jgi:Tfp pilus assembly protein PilF
MKAMLKTTTLKVISTLVIFATVGSAQAQESARPEIGKPLQAAHDLMMAGKYRDALAKVREAEAVPNPNAYERFMLDRIRGVAAASAGDDVTAGKSFESALASGRLQPAESLPLLEALANSAYRTKDYAKAIDWAKRYFQAGGKSEQVRNLKTASHYQMGDYAGVVNDMQQKIKSVEESTPVVDETTLRMLAASYAKLNDAGGYAATLDKLLIHHPKQEYWDDRLARLQSSSDFSERLMLDVYRLRVATGTMDTAEQYAEMAELALQAGLPFEAKRITEAGYAAGKLGGGAEADRHKRLRNLAVKQAAEDDKALSAEVVGRNGDALVNTGIALVCAGRLDRGIELLEQGISKGGVKRLDEARLHLGEAYLQGGKKAKAIEAFKAVRGGEGLGDLARLWSIHAARI